jgi:hypothetical protein
LETLNLPFAAEVCRASAGLVCEMAHIVQVHKVCPAQPQIILTSLLPGLVYGKLIPGAIY